LMKELFITKDDAPWLARPVGTWIGFVSIGGGFIICMLSDPPSMPGILDVIVGASIGWAIEQLIAPLTIAYLREWAFYIRAGQIWVQVFGPRPGYHNHFLPNFVLALGGLATYAVSYAIRDYVPITGRIWTSGSGKDWFFAPVVCYMVSFFLLLIVRYRNWYNDLPESSQEG
jgi:hypothetical protein